MSKKIPVDKSSSEKLVETAERLFGLHGMEGVSLRQISKAAGHANNYAVQYHFGSAEGLIRAILERNIPHLEVMRARMLAEVKQRNRVSDIPALMGVLYRPLVDHRDSQGERSYARFVLALYNSPAHVNYMGVATQLMPIGLHVRDLVETAVEDIPPTLIGERLRLITIMFLTSIFNRIPPFSGHEPDEALIDDALGMATAALLAPVPDDLRQMLAEK